MNKFPSSVVYWRSHAAPVAVRNRKTYFKETIEEILLQRGCIHVLSVASGPGRDMSGIFTMTGGERLRFDCVEQGVNAIEYASKLNEEFLSRITFAQTNALRFLPQKQCDLVWSAGLCDYFDDRVFKRMLQRLVRAVLPGGELIIGNFSQKNPSRFWMELSEWHLHYRDRECLNLLALESGIPAECIRIGEEPQGVNLFLPLKIPEGGCQQVLPTAELSRDPHPQQPALRITARTIASFNKRWR